MAVVLATALGTGLGIAAVPAGATSFAGPSQARASAQAVNWQLGGALTLATPPTTATSDGSADDTQSESPAVDVLAGQSLLSAGVLAERAVAHQDGSSAACAGVLSPGGGIQIGTDGTCTSTGTGGVSLDLNQIPGVGAVLSSIATVELTADAVTAHARADGSSQSGGAELTGLSAHVKLFGLAVKDVSISLTGSPNEDVLAALTSALEDEGTQLLDPLITALNGPVRDLVSITANHQDTEGGPLSVSALHILLSNGLTTADIAEVTVGPNQALGTPAIDSLRPDHGPLVGGDTVVVTGTNFVPGSTVDFDGTTVTPDSVDSSTSLTFTVPPGTASGNVSGPVNVSVTTPAGTTGTLPYTYDPPTLSADSPVTAGDDLPVSGSGWPAATEVTVQLRDSSGDVVGSPIRATTGVDGSLPAGTTLAVPAEAVPGPGYQVNAQDVAGDTAQDTVEVLSAEDAGDGGPAGRTDPAPADPGSAGSAGGTGTSSSHDPGTSAAATPVARQLPNTGAPSGLLLAGLAGLVLVGAGATLLWRRRTGLPTGRPVREQR